MAVSFIGGGNWITQRKPLTCRKSRILYQVHLARVGFELTTSKMIGTDCTDSCKSNYHTITTVMAPKEECCVIINMHKVWPTFRAGLSYRLFRLQPRE